LPRKKRLILWNEFGCQLSEKLDRFLMEHQLGNLLIPGVYVDAINVSYFGVIF
jgi:hypothetical protein